MIKRIRPSAGVTCRRFFGRAPGGARFLRVQVPDPPGSGKDIAEGKGVHREMESEGSQMWEPTNPRANLWSDRQEPHIRLYMRVSLRHKTKPDSYMESCAVNAADGCLKGQHFIQK